MSVSESIESLKQYLDKTIAAGNRAAKSTSNSSAATPGGGLQQSLRTQTSSSALSALKQNPILNTAIDTVNQAVTSMAQQVVVNAIKKVNLTPLQNASQQFFTLFASVTSFGTEVAMELARNTGRNLVAEMAKKDSVSKRLEEEVVALYNACAIMLNGQPFFDQYLSNVIQAYDFINRADINLKDVSRLLKVATPRYQKRKFSQSIVQLTSARDLILPDRGVDVSSIRGATDFVNATLNRQSNKQVYAAALSIPGITVNIAKLALEYELLSISVNAYITTYVNALNDYIAGYTQSKSVNQATIDHIEAGTSQIDTLLAEMAAILNQNTGSTTDVGFRARLSTYGIKWGVQVTAIIEWLKLNPGAGSDLLSKTSASVEAYVKSTTAITAIGNVSYSGGTVVVNEGKEDAFAGLVKPMTKFLVNANLVVATSNSKTDIRQQASGVRRYLQTARKVDANIIAAIQPFLNTKTTISGDVGKGLNKLIGFANKTGLDRLAGLVSAGDIKNLFAANPQNATYTGAALVGLNSIIQGLRDAGTATSQQVSQIETLRDQVSREQKAKEIYAGRSSQQTQDADADQREAKIQTDKGIVQSATAAAEQIDASVGTDPATQSEKLLTGQVTPGAVPPASDLKASLSTAGSTPSYLDASAAALKSVL